MHETTGDSKSKMSHLATSSREKSKKDEDFVRVAETSEVKDGEMKRIEIDDGTSIVLVRIGSEYHAIGDVCTHEEFHLSDGTLEGHRVVCPGHGAEWDLNSGTAKFDEELPPEPVYAVRVEGKTILLSRYPANKK